MPKRRTPQLVFWILLVAILIVALIPGENAPTLFASDKLNHILAFFVLALLTRIVWPRLRPIVAFAFLAFYGGLIEISQWWLDFGRTADWGDFGADIVAIIAGLIAGGVVSSIWRRIAVSG